jgi:hypothetical protein
MTPLERHRIERRVSPDRRRGFERRVVDRRFESRWMELEQRRGVERRDSERRSPMPRRRLGNGRGSGLSFTERDPS